MRTIFRPLILSAAFAATIYSGAALARSVSMEKCLLEVTEAVHCTVDSFTSTSAYVKCIHGTNNAKYALHVGYAISWTAESGWSCDRKTGWELVVQDFRDLF